MGPTLPRRCPTTPLIPASTVLATPASRKSAWVLLQFWPLAQQRRRGPSYRSPTARMTSIATRAGRATSIGGWTCASITISAAATGSTRRCIASTGTIRTTTFSRTPSAAILRGISPPARRRHRHDVLEVISPTLVDGGRPAWGFDDFDKLVTSLGQTALTWKYATYAQGVAGFAQLDNYINPSIERMPNISPAGVRGAPPGANPHMEPKLYLRALRPFNQDERGADDELRVGHAGPKG